MFPTGWIGHDKPFISEKRRIRYLPLPIHIAAGRGASDEPAWNGVAVDCGKERSVTQQVDLSMPFKSKARQFMDAFPPRTDPEFKSKLQRTHTPLSNVPHNPNNSNRPQSQQEHRQQPSHPHQTKGPEWSLPSRTDHRTLALVGMLTCPASEPVQQEPQHVAPAPVHSRPPNVPGNDTRDKFSQDEIEKVRAQL